jgi:hypothetical protein
MTEFPRADPSVWRYMNFGRFVGLLKSKQLWLSRGDLLGDEWEGAYSTAQLTAMFEKIPHDYIGHGKRYPDRHAAIDAVHGFTTRIPKCFYANCWTKRERESYLMWRAYCPSREAVAIQTTFDVLRASLPEAASLVRVNYAHGHDQDFSPLVVASHKRPEFEEEAEVRALIFDPNDLDTPDTNPAGRAIDWEPAKHVHQIRVHPRGGPAFLETVKGVVEARQALTQPVTERT